MALFKILKGPLANLANQPKTEGYAYVAKTGNDSADFYVDYNSTTRLKINKRADEATLADTAEVANTLADKPTLAITNGNTAGPILEVGAGGKTSDKKTFPSASTTISGVVTTGSQTFAGNKLTTGTHIGLVSGGENDQFLDFAYGSNPTASTAPGASWRLGALNSGSGDANYFVIETGGSTTSATVWNKAVRIGMNTLDVALGHHLIPIEAENEQTIGTSSYKWYAMYAQKFVGALQGTADFAKRWSNARTVTFEGDVTGSFSIDGSDNVSGVTLTVTDNSHKHTIDNITNLQTTLNNISAALDLKAPLASPALTGTPTAPTATAGTNTTQIATTAFVTKAVGDSFAANDAMLFKGTIGTGGTVTSLPATHNVGWTYRVITAGTYAGVKCEIGDLIICIADGTTASNAHWTVAQTNIDGAVIRNVTTAVGSTTLPVYVDASGVVQPLSYSLSADVPSDAVFTDKKVSQSRSNASQWRPLLSHYTYAADGTDPGSATNTVYYNENIAVQYTTGTLKATNFAIRAGGSINAVGGSLIIPTAQPSSLVAGSIWIST